MSDLSSDIGRIERQNLIIEAVIDKAKKTYNPLTVASFISSLAHDVTLDSKLGPTTLLSLAERYHALSGSSLNSYTLPTIPGVYAPYGNEDVEVVQEPEASQTIAAFLRGAPQTPSTPPLNQYGDAETVSAVAPSTTTVPTTASTPSTSSSGASSSNSTPTDSVPSFDPRPC